MTAEELKSMTVTELRAYAKSHAIHLTGITAKAAIIEKILSAAPVSGTESDIPAGSAAPQETVPEKPQTTYQAAWHAPSQQTQPPRYNARPSYQSSAAAKPAWQNTTPSGRPIQADNTGRGVQAQPRPSRFGPAARQPVQPRQDTASPAPAERRFGPGATSFGSVAASFGPRTSQPAMQEQAEERVSGRNTADSNAAAPAFSRPASTLSGPRIPEGIPSESGITAPTLEDLLLSEEMADGSGVLELHPDGYGFLRAPSFLPSSKDIYVSLAQIRRFALRTGDFVEGRIRPRREGDKYAALLLVRAVNGVPADEISSRPQFDELTPDYPARKICLEPAEKAGLPNMRLIDLIAPIGFGQRGLMLCQPDTGKRALIRDLAFTITENHPETTVVVLLIDANPEDVTVFRDSVSCSVYASTFDQPPENHLRLADMVLEHSMRLVEQKKDVVLIVDSLTRLAKIYTTAATQQGRSMPGMVNPTSLFKAKRLFGAARSLREGGSLTVIAAMDVETGSRVDESVTEEFKGSANMLLYLDRAVAAAGVNPCLDLNKSFTRNTDKLLNEKEKEGLRCIRNMLGTVSSVDAIPQLISMMGKTATNTELLLRMKDWFAMMSKSR
ncbi:MAG: transcription termination factor Rho [Clostridia bacterium]|nr:transcription termination factor Rho [Clostridia bacterium]